VEPGTFGQYVVLAVGTAGVPLLPDTGRRQDHVEGPGEGDGEDDGGQQEDLDPFDLDELEILEEEDDGEHLSQAEGPAGRDPAETDPVQPLPDRRDYGGDGDGSDPPQYKGHDAGVTDGHLHEPVNDDGALDGVHGPLEALGRIRHGLQFGVENDPKHGRKVREQSALNDRKAVPDGSLEELYSKSNREHAKYKISIEHTTMQFELHSERRISPY